MHVYVKVDVDVHVTASVSVSAGMCSCMDGCMDGMYAGCMNIWMHGCMHVYIVNLNSNTWTTLGFENSRPSSTLGKHLATLLNPEGEGRWGSAVWPWSWLSWSGRLVVVMLHHFLGIHAGRMLGYKHFVKLRDSQVRSRHVHLHITSVCGLECWHRRLCIVKKIFSCTWRHTCRGLGE